MDLTDAEVARFLDARRRVAPTGLRTERALAPLLEHLRRLGAVPGPTVVLSKGPRERLLARYRDFLMRERGLRPGTVTRYLRTARLFLEDRAMLTGVPGLADPVGDAHWARASWSAMVAMGTPEAAAAARRL